MPKISILTAIDATLDKGRDSFEKPNPRSDLANDPALAAKLVDKTRVLREHLMHVLGEEQLKVKLPIAGEDHPFKVFEDYLADRATVEDVAARIKGLIDRSQG